MTQAALEVSCSDVRDWRSQTKDFLLVDCREPDEHAVVAIDGALLLPMSELVDGVCELAGKENQPLVVYCHHGQRSAQVTAWLREQGFSNAQSMAGGIDAWAVEIEPGMVRY